MPHYRGLPHYGGQLGEQQQKVVANKEQYINAALQRGVTQARIDRFLTTDPEDYHRLSSLAPEGASTVAGPAAAPPPAVAPPSAAVAGLAGPTAAPPSAALTGLQQAAPNAEESLAPTVGLSTPSRFRTGIGQRILPDAVSILGQLQRRIY